MIAVSRFKAKNIADMDVFLPQCQGMGTSLSACGPGLSRFQKGEQNTTLSKIQDEEPD
jgi:hypothetical protein